MLTTLPLLCGSSCAKTMGGGSDLQHTTYRHTYVVFFSLSGWATNGAYVTGGAVQAWAPVVYAVLEKERKAFRARSILIQQ